MPLVESLHAGMYWVPALRSVFIEDKFLSF